MNEKQRLEQIIANEGMTAKQFAQEVGIQAGTISNILNGRNKPSLDVMQRVLNRFRTLSSDWLILGVGSMYRQKGEPTELSLFDIRPETNTQKEENNQSIEDKKVVTIKEKEQETPAQNSIAQNTLKVSKTVSKIVIFYSDGTFEER